MYMKNMLAMCTHGTIAISNYMHHVSFSVYCIAKKIVATWASQVYGLAKGKHCCICMEDC